MGTATSENEVHYTKEPIDRPKVYLCSECSFPNEFTQQALDYHKRTCSHKELCSCYVCKSNANEDARPTYARESRIPQSRNILFKNLLPSAFIKSTENRVTVQSGNLVKDNQIIPKKRSFTSLYILQTSEKKGVEGRSESSDSWENGRSEDFPENPKKRLLFVRPVAFVDSNAKCIGEKLPENADILENNHDGEPCNRKIYCVICKSHIFWESFGTHVVQHSIKTENSQLICPDCNQNFRSPNLYLMHFFQHINYHSCSECDCNHPNCMQRSTPPPAEHRYAETETSCYICLKTFTGNSSVLAHLKLHAKECPFTCEECHRSFRQTGNLQRHMLTHRGEKPHKCPQCSIGFSDPATLRNHIRTHTKETPFVCKVCKRGFSQVGNLKRHMALHVQKDLKDASVVIINGGQSEKSVGVVEEEIGPDDEKSSGSEFFSDHEARKAGDALVSGESQEGQPRRRGKNGQFKLHVCKLCGKKYAWRHDLNIHFRTHTGEKPYKCEECGKQFAQSGAVRMHKIRHHNKSKFVSKKQPPRLKVVSLI